MHSGVYLFDTFGKILMHISKKDGLQNNEIREVFSDRGNNLWVNNKMGIDFIELATPFRHIKLNADEPIGIYSTSMYQNKVLFATHNGLIAKDFTNNEAYTIIPTPADINWTVSRHKAHIVVGHAKGFTQFIDQKPENLYDSDGGWLIKQLSVNSNYWIGGTYSGLVLFKDIEGTLVFQNKIEGFDESSRVIVIDKHDNIWIAHGYKGIYRLKLSQNMKKVNNIAFYDYHKGLPSAIYNNVFEIWDEVVFGTQQGIYTYDVEKDTMIVHQRLSDLLGKGHCKQLLEDKQGNLWFVINDQTGILRRHNNGQFTKETRPFNKLNDFYIPGFENFYFLDNNITLIGTKDGAVIYDARQQTGKTKQANVLIRKISTTNRNRLLYDDNLSFLCNKQMEESFELPYIDNDLLINFSSVFYENTEDLKYKFFLQGFDDDWSDWKGVEYKEYTNLHEGDYLFRIKAMNVYGQVSEEAVYRFSVKPPLFRSVYAYIAYAISIALLFSIALNIRNTKAKAEKKRYIEKQERIRKIERANFVEEKLKAELDARNQELSAAATKVIYKNEKLNELKEKLVVIMGHASDKVERKLKTLLNFIESEIEDDDWEDFELRFDQAHNNFIKNLKTEFPNLTPKDLKMKLFKVLKQNELNSLIN